MKEWGAVVEGGESSVENECLSLSCGEQPAGGHVQKCSVAPSKLVTSSAVLCPYLCWYFPSNHHKHHRHATCLFLHAHGALLSQSQDK